ncbi:ECF transporter S component [Candidatus Chloroploca asiatica]|uniref:Uncharacterized protein n=1 Tax=Candidatus Chloroploca asiatica TaxID=1506545 RepID=A0A2H3KLN0_9CHLR|nr:ECF transporter S component [Candidatus Chloroploca asiatica]PDV98983.1 hypothetical protein A9Q02_14125 [Candidatus Chloroploca asiatica]
MTAHSSTTPKRGLMAWTTRDLMILMAIALVFGLLLTGMTYAFVLTMVFLTPMLSNGLFGGIWLLPAFMASYVLRRPGTALLTSLLYSLVMVPFSPYGVGVVFGGLIGGLCYELPFLFTRYRSYGLPMLVFGGAWANLATVLIHVPLSGGVNLAPGIWVLVVLVALVSGALGGWLATVLANALSRTGVLRATAMENDQGTVV